MVGSGDIPSTSTSGRVAAGDHVPEVRIADRDWTALDVVEVVAIKVATDAARISGRLAAAPAVCHLFQVCSTWSAVSDSDSLWEKLTTTIWNRRSILGDRRTWRNEFIYRYRTANNFRFNRCIHTAIQIPIPPPDNIYQESVRCVRLALSDVFLAAGFSNGMVKLYDLNFMQHHVTHHPEPRDRPVPFSNAVTGIVLSETHLVFANLEGDIYVVVLNPAVGNPRRARHGDIFRNGHLVDFAGCGRWWVGLYLVGRQRAFHVWNSATEQLVFTGSTPTVPHMSLTGGDYLHRLSNSVGRVRARGQEFQETAIACTRWSVIEFKLAGQDTVVLGQEEFARPLAGGCVDVVNESVLLVDERGLATVKRALRLNEEVCRFMVTGVGSDASLVCLNGGYAICYTAAGGFISIWNAETGENLYTIRERMGGQVSALIADERYLVAASFGDSSTLHMWDFGVA